MEKASKTRFLPSRLTAILLLCVAGVWGWLNVVENGQYWNYEASAYTHHGYPFDAIITYDYKDMFIDVDKRVQFGFEAETVPSSDGDRYCCDIVTPYASTVLIPSGIVMDILFGLGMVIGAVLLSKLLSHCRERGWLQFHLSTAVLLMVASGQLIAMNFVRSEDRGDEQTHRTYFRGWPWRAYEEQASYGSETQYNDDAEPYESEWYVGGLVLNLSLAMFFILVLAFFFEHLIPVLHLRPMTCALLTILAFGMLAASFTRHSVTATWAEFTDLHQEVDRFHMPERAGLWQGNVYGWPLPCSYNLWSYGAEHDNVIKFSFINMLVDSLTLSALLFVAGVICVLCNGRRTRFLSATSRTT